ncbi:MAG: Rap1a/Tai family immunity protein, partial [Dongiaceae bacterium]
PRNYFKTMACRAEIPGGTTYGQAADIVARYLRDHTDQRAAEGSDLVDRALGAAFPCDGQ